MNTGEFLAFVLPKRGVYFAALPLATKGYKHVACHTVEELTNVIENTSGNVFYALAGFEKPAYEDAAGKTKRRTGDNAERARSQWLDIDVSNQYSGSQRTGLLALVEFCNTSGLRRPNVVVNSGNGLHCYWVFEDDVPKAQWRAAANTFKAIVKHFNFAQDDTSRTADIASVLRPIGTINDKTSKGLGIKPVTLVGEVTENLWSFKDWVTKLVEIRDKFGIKVGAINNEKPKENINTDLGGDPEYQSSSADVVAEHCAQIRDFRDTKGRDQDEAQWYRSLGVVGFCADASRAVEWSSGHPGFSAGATEAKIIQWKTNAGPTTCEAFRASNVSERCTGCPHSVTSPILLGRVGPEHVTSKVHATDGAANFGDADDDGGLGEEVVNVETFPDFPTAVKERFRWTGEKLQGSVLDPQGVQTWRTICNMLSIPTGYFFDPETKGWSIQLSVRAKPFDWRTVEIPMKEIGRGKEALLSELAAKANIVAKDGPLLEKYMKTWIDNIHSTTKETTMHGRMGWYDDGSFLLGAVRYQPDGTTKTVMLKDTVRHLAEVYRPRGDLQTYIDLIDKIYNRVNHESFQFAWLSGFASVLVPLVYKEGASIGIPIVSWSKETGRGKTSVSKAALSIWGDPTSNESAVIPAGNSTDYALQLKVAMHHHLPVLIDETTTWDSKRTAKFAYDYSAGQPRLAGAKDGGLRNTHGANWANFCFLTTNNCVSDMMMTHMNNCAPQLSRMFEYQNRVQNYETLDAETGPKVLAQIFNNSGQAGDVFIRYVVANKKKIEQSLEATRETFIKMAELSKDARYWAMTAACVWVAFAISRQLGLQKFDAADLKEWILLQLRSLNSTNIVSLRDPVDAFSNMMSQLQSGFIITLDVGDQRN